MKFFLSILLLIGLGFQAFAAPTAITPVVPDESAYDTAWSDVDAVNGNSILNAGENVVLVLNNPSLLSATATVEIQEATQVIPGYGSVTKSSVTCTIATDRQCVMGPFPGRFWNDGNSRLQLTYGGAGSANLDIVALKVSPIQ